MSEIGYQSLNDYLDDRQHGGFAPVYLIHGEETLYKTAATALLDALIPADRRSLNYEPMEGTGHNIRDAIERVNTYSLLAGTKVVALYDADIFYAKQDEGQLLSKVMEAHAANDRKSAARYFLNLLGIMNLSFEDLRGESKSKVLKLDVDNSGDSKWLDDIIRHCREKGRAIPAIEDSAEALQRAVAKGFPRGNHLIITTEWVDKRRALYKIIKREGVIIDCSVPKGDRRADKIAQEAVLSESLNSILKKFNKTIDESAYQAVCTMTGFDLRTFNQNLEKLVNYVGDREEITVEDVEYVLERTKKDPIYELTNAIADRDVEKSLYFLESLLAAEFHPLQILAAMTNQIRRLLLIKSFVESSRGSNWHAGVSYGYFKSRIMPEIQAHDRDISDLIESWECAISKSKDTDDQGRTQKTSKKKSKLAADLMVVKNPNNPYPVYRMLLQSERYRSHELVAALERLSGADLRLKSSGHRPKLILEEAVLKICGTSASEDRG